MEVPVIRQAVSFEEFYSSYTGLNKTRLLELATLDGMLLEPVVFNYFMKRELLLLSNAPPDFEGNVNFVSALRELFDVSFGTEFEKQDDVNLKDPRLIATTPDDYMVMLSCWCKPFSKAFAEMYHPYSRGNVHLIYSGGLDAEELGRLYGDAIARCPDGPLFIEIDFSRFDRCVSVQALQFEFAHYRRGGATKFVQSLFAEQLHTHGRSKKYDIKYTVPGTRKSGTPNTSIGNSILNFSICGHIMRALGISAYTMFAMGDDNLVVCNAAGVGDLAGYPARIAELSRPLGFKAEAILHTNSLAPSFCSGRFWPVGTGYVFGPKITRILAKSFWWIPDKGVSMRKYRKTVEASLYDIVGHVPVLHRLKLVPGAYVRDEWRVYPRARLDLSQTDWDYSYSQLAIAVNDHCGTSFTPQHFKSLADFVSRGDVVLAGILVECLCRFDDLIGPDVHIE